VTAAAIAEGLAHFLSDPDRARSAGEQARASERLYSRDRFAAEWADIFSAGEHAVPSPVRVRSS
jgi:glycosyltransferase involved in cell wall biosynthesis